MKSPFRTCDSQRRARRLEPLVRRGGRKMIDKSHRLGSFDLGPCTACYSGSGRLKLSSGDSVACSFQTGQLSDGRVVLVCDLGSTYAGRERSVVGFSGISSEGLLLESE